MLKKPSPQFALRAGEIILAIVLAFGFRQLVDWFLSPLPLGQWIILIRWLLLVLFIGAAVRLHGFLMDFLKKKGMITQDPWS
jgi:hypothetical protein